FMERWGVLCIFIGRFFWPAAGGGSLGRGYPGNALLDFPDCQFHLGLCLGLVVIGHRRPWGRPSAMVSLISTEPAASSRAVKHRAPPVESLLIRGNDRSHRKERIAPGKHRRTETGYAAVKKESVGRAKSVAKKTRKTPERDRGIGDCEYHRVRIAQADAVADFARRAARMNLRMDVAVDDEHRARLGGKL